MDTNSTAMTAQQIEDLKPFFYILAVIPGLLAIRFILFMILPKSILRRFFRSKEGYKNKDALKRKKHTLLED